MIQVLCHSCSTHLMNTDLERLDYPLRGEMFDVVVPGWFLRPGPINLDIFCPYCQMYPFTWDPSVHGAVGKYLCIKGPDGKPLDLTIKQILMGDLATPKHSQSGPVIQADGMGVIKGLKVDKKSSKQSSEWPCPECGAKKRFHRAGCSLKTGTSHVALETCDKCGATLPNHKKGCPVRKGCHVPGPDDKILAGLVATTGGNKTEDPDIIPPEEVQAMLQERERRQGSEKKEPYLRPGEGFAPRAK